MIVNVDYILFQFIASLRCFLYFPGYFFGQLMLCLSKETYGNSSSDSSDEDFDDTTTQKRRKTDCEKTEVKSSNKTPITKSNIHTKDENQKGSKHFPKQTWKNDADGGTNESNESSAKVGSASTGSKRSTHKRLGEATTQVFIACF